MSTTVEPARTSVAPRGFTPAILGLSALLLAGIITGHLSGSDGGMIDWADFLPIAAVTFTAVGALVVHRRPANAVGWLFLAAGVSSAVAVLGGSYGNHPVGAWLYAWSPALAYGLFPLALLLFPNGALPSPGWRPVAWFMVVATVVTAVGFAVAAWHQPTLLVVERLPGPPSPVLVTARVGLLCLLVSAVIAVVSLGVRWRRASGVARQQLKWLGIAALSVPIGFVAQIFLVPGAWAVTGVAVPAAAALAILRYRLYDIDLFLNRSLVYFTLTVLVVAGYVAIVAGLAMVFTDDEDLLRVIAAGVVAVAFAPLRERVQRAVDRLLYGDRANPYAAISRLSRLLERAVDPSAVLPQVVETVAKALHLPYVAIVLVDAPEGERPMAGYGRPVGEPEAFEMTYQGDEVGTLLASPRSPGGSFSGAERMLLEELARHAGSAAHTVGLTDDLRRSRERLIRSQEEERRRLRRDLHDGLGPALAGMTMQVGAARAVLAEESAGESTVASLLTGLETQLQACIRDIRRLVDNLVPTVLDRLGLVGAIRHKAVEFSSAAPVGAPTIDVVTPDDLPELPAAVEVAAYRIATEAMTNLVRHACARTATVRLDLDNGLVIEVVDDGRGLPPELHPGVGLSSMRERADELGGTCRIEPVEGGGTRVRAVLPLSTP
jgi:signal transduction histidine kinase